MAKAFRIGFLFALVAIASVMMITACTKTVTPVQVSSQGVSYYMGNPAIDGVRYLGHQGKLYSAYVYSASVPANGNLDLFFVTDPTTATTPVKTYAMFQWSNGSSIVVTGNVALYEYENTSISTTISSTVSIVAQDPSVTVVPKTKIYTNALIVTTGTLKTVVPVPINTVLGTQENEYILIPGRNYLFRFNNPTAEVHSMSQVVLFYEGLY